MKICIVGMGYVGLPLSIAFSKHYDVIGFDVNNERIKKLSDGIDANKEVEGTELESCSIDFTDDEKRISEADFVIVCVPTPIDEKNQPDLSLLKSASETVGKNLKNGAIIIYESTVYPGVTEEVCKPIIEKFSDTKCGVGFKLGYSP